MKGIEAVPALAQRGRPGRRFLSFIDLDARMAIGFVPSRWISGLHETIGKATSCERRIRRAA